MSDARPYPTLHPFWEGYISETKATHRHVEETLLARIEALTADRDKGAKDYCDLMDRYDAVCVGRDAAQARADALAEKLEAWLEVASHCSIEEGVCCCGDNMENHSHPMNCGHSPVDHGAYVAMQLVEDTRATLAQITGGKTDG